MVLKYRLGCLLKLAALQCKLHGIREFTVEATIEFTASSSESDSPNEAPVGTKSVALDNTLG